MTTPSLREQEILDQASAVIRSVQPVDRWVPSAEEASLLLTAMAIRSEHTVHEEERASG